MILLKQDKPNTEEMRDTASVERWGLQFKNEEGEIRMSSKTYASFGAANFEANQVLFAFPKWTVRIVPIFEDEKPNE